MSQEPPMTGEVFATVYLSKLDSNVVNLVRWNALSKHFEYESGGIWLRVPERFFSGAKVITLKDFE